MKTAVRLILIAILFAACISSESISADFNGPTEDGWHTWQTTAADGGNLQVYAQINSGQAVDIRLRGNSTCWDNHERTAIDLDQASDLGKIAANDSAMWLRSYIDPRSDISSEAMLAVSQHAGALPVEILIGIIKTGTDQELREEALFWLAQSDSDEAFEMLDKLLSAD